MNTRFSQVNDGELPPQVLLAQQIRLATARKALDHALAQNAARRGETPLSAKYVGGGFYEVVSEKGVKKYAVALHRRHATCDCPHFLNRLSGTGKECKHILAARQECFRRTLRAARLRSPEELESALARGGWMPEETAAIRQALSEIQEPGDDDPAWATQVRRYEVNGTPASSYR